MNDTLYTIALLQQQGMNAETIAKTLGMRIGTVTPLMYRNTIDQRIWTLQDRGMSNADIRRMLWVSDRRINIATERRKDRAS